MDISLIICTHNRCQQLRACLEAVSCIEFKGDWELIVVDNGSTDETASVVDNIASTASVAVTYVNERRRGLANAHNAGLAVAAEEIVAFTDDDCYPASDFWRKFGTHSRTHLSAT